MKYISLSLSSIIVILSLLTGCAPTVNKNNDIQKIMQHLEKIDHAIIKLYRDVNGLQDNVVSIKNKVTNLDKDIDRRFAHHKKK